MAAVAALAELTLVRVIVGVAVDAAFAGQRGVDRFDVAVGAFDVRMGAMQRKVRIRVVIEGDIQPSRGAVTVAAGWAVDAVMYVILEVATVALGRRRLLELVPGVARLAIDVRVAAGKRETCRREMIERDVFPVGRGMAALALCTVGALMHVVGHVAGDALIARVGVLFARVTAHASNGPVSPGERVAGLGLVVEVRIGPTRGLVTIRALPAEMAEVPVVVGVAGDTVGLGVVKGQIRRVAVFAVRVDVAAEQRELGQVVIETGPIQSENVGVAALVLGVALGTRRAAVGRLHIG